MKAITTHYIDVAFVESHGREVVDIIRPTDGQVIGRVTLGDEEDTRRAIGAARRAFATFGRTTKEERAGALRRLTQRKRRSGSPTIPNTVCTPASSGLTSSARVAWPHKYDPDAW